jgi:hypothetical protein
MTKIAFVTRRLTDAKPEILFSSDKSAEAVEFYRQFKGAGEVCLFVHPTPERTKKNKSEAVAAELIQDAPKRARKALL